MVPSKGILDINLSLFILFLSCSRHWKVSLAAPCSRSAFTLWIHELHCWLVKWRYSLYCRRPLSRRAKHKNPPPPPPRFSTPLPHLPQLFAHLERERLQWRLAKIWHPTFLLLPVCIKLISGPVNCFSSGMVCKNEYWRVRGGAVLVSHGILSFNLANILIGYIEPSHTQRSVNLHISEATILSNFFRFKVIFFRSKFRCGIRGRVSVSAFKGSFKEKNKTINHAVLRV